MHGLERIHANDDRITAYDDPDWRSISEMHRTCKGTSVGIEEVALDSLDDAAVSD